MTIAPDNMLLCVFSYNMGRTLGNCLESIERHMPGYSLMIADDRSDDAKTVQILEQWQNKTIEIYTPTQINTNQGHGNLYHNIQYACDRAQDLGYRFLFMIQDDMQFVMPFTEEIAKEYGAQFEGETTLQIDPRFTKQKKGYEIDHSRHCYRRVYGSVYGTYSDVGILDLKVLKKTKWRFVEGEGNNNRALEKLGLVYLIPFTPIVMHVPFPPVYRDRKRRKKLTLVRHGAYIFHDLTAKQIKALRNRNIADIPFYRKYLKPTNMIFAWIWYRLKKSSAVFR